MSTQKPKYKASEIRTDVQEANNKINEAINALKAKYGDDIVLVYPGELEHVEVIINAGTFDLD